MGFDNDSETLSTCPGRTMEERKTRIGAWRGKDLARTTTPARLVIGETCPQTPRTTLRSQSRPIHIQRQFRRSPTSSSSPTTCRRLSCSRAPPTRVGCSGARPRTVPRSSTAARLTSTHMSAAYLPSSARVWRSLVTRLLRLVQRRRGRTHGGHAPAVHVIPRWYRRVQNKVRAKCSSMCLRADTAHRSS
jgi:hypothetical protein